MAHFVFLGLGMIEGSMAAWRLRRWAGVVLLQRKLELAAQIVIFDGELVDAFEET
jgi:hypothetical protein